MDSLVVFSHSLARESATAAQPKVEEEAHDLSVHGEEERLPEPSKKKRWVSIYVLCFTVFLNCSTFSIIMSSIWPFLLEIDNENASAKFLGWVLAAFSFGQLVGSPLLGYWGEKRSTREPLIIALLITVLFSVVYSYCEAFQSGLAGWVMLVSRTMVGFGAGAIAVVRSYVSEATTEMERTGALAGISSAQGLGYILGPALGLVFVPLGSKGVSIDVIRFRLNVYTGPGYLSALLGIVCIILLVFIFQESKLIKSIATKEKVFTKPLLSVVKMMKLFAGYLRNLSVSDSQIAFGTVSSNTTSRKSFDRMAALVTIIFFFVSFVLLSIYESVGPVLTMDEFAWTRKQAVLYNNIFYLGMSVLSILTYVAIKLVAKWIDERVILMVAFFISAFGYFCIIPMTDEPPKVAQLLGRMSEHSISEQDIFNNLTVIELAGCRDPPQTWCTEVGRIYLPQYIVSLVLFAVGFSAASLTSLTIFSKILGPFPQGMMMGFLTAAGSLARGMGPLIITLLYEHKGPAVTFSTVDGLLGVSIILLLIFCHRLVPYRPA